jgi:hypothetical protein
LHGYQTLASYTSFGLHVRAGGSRLQRKKQIRLAGLSSTSGWCLKSSKQ